MQERPGWIELLFKRGHGRCAFKTRCLLDSHREFIQDAVAGGPDDREQLRSASLAALDSKDSSTVIQALAFLLVVGDAADLQRVEQLTLDRRESVSKAARACRFELQQRPKTGGQ